MLHWRICKIRTRRTTRTSQLRDQDAGPFVGSAPRSVNAAQKMNGRACEFEGKRYLPRRLSAFWQNAAFFASLGAT
jgi:hypothetical protein